MISEHKLDKLQAEMGFDRLTAWRHLRDQERARRLYSYQERGRIFVKW
jgi:hypothetical protein